MGRWWEQTISVSISQLVNVNKLCVGVCFTTWSWWRSLGFETINVAKTNTSWEHYNTVISVLYSWSSFSAPHLLSEAECACFFFSFQSSVNPLNPSSESYLPPFKGFIREDAVLSGHQRVDGLIEALSKPGVVLQLCHALSTGAQAFGEKVVRQAKSWLEEVERGVPESITEQERCECKDTKQQSKSPEFPRLEHRHVVTVKITLGVQRTKIASW